MQYLCEVGHWNAHPQRRIGKLYPKFECIDEYNDEYNDDASDEVETLAGVDAIDLLPQHEAIDDIDIQEDVDDEEPVLEQDENLN